MGFKVPKTFQITKYPQHLDFSHSDCVIKPLDLCDSHGVYLIKDGKNIKTGDLINKKQIINDLQKIRSNIGDEYYMHDKMYDGLVPYTGYIVEELLLDENNDVPCDYKCYLFGGKIYFIGITYNRKVVKSVQSFDSIWLTRDWKPVKQKMLKNGYKFKKTIKKPECYEKMIKLVENLGKKLKRHCRIDIYIIKNEVYLGELTFFCGAILHTFYCNLILGYLWLKNPDDYEYLDDKLKDLVPDYYNKP
tara:strand:+ start:537 stop:1277 length:741 start_codon:yes stop_codon:yes gene_type:complete